MRLLLTRPQPDAERTAAVLRERGHAVVVAPLIRIEPIPDVEFGQGPWDAILITSANAALAIAAHKRRDALVRVPVLAVGERSAQAMRAFGFTDVTASGGGVEELVRFVAARMPPKASLLYLAGQNRAGDLAAALRASGYAVETAVVYRAVAAEKLPEAAADAIAAGIDGVLHFSRRSADAYVNAARAAGMLERALKPAHFCLSNQVAEPLRQVGAATIRVAARPVEAALIEFIGLQPE